ncbi:branched-chain amino acid aminotransferase [Formicincola oecophyllae]|uniref:Probable branched-chain-amino-acid aminotransferase n=1 Tax=Formicincola oecophyllae TaxID=2558361 RepID=A0A4Y6U8Y8_9PROT|nr:branched-chain amino acid aminotransferase [Formicincola oecophyllae]QDH13664.1 branched-chain amino acid aminotransferase [Formicincola oecophyllae]
MSAEKFKHIPHPNPTPEAERRKLLAEGNFGKVFSDHMFLMDYDPEKGWHDGRLEARRPFALDPASLVLHYGQEIFEGMKAFKGPDGTVTVFRPEANGQRLAASARRLAMPEMPVETFVSAIDALVQKDSAWVPEAEGHSLYLRPFMIAHDAFLGVKPAERYLFAVIASPVGNYFAKPTVDVWVTERYTRAAPGGTGEAKCGGNYAGGLVAQREAYSQKCDQVLFLDSTQGHFVEEMGGMNVMFVRKDGSVVTPPLDGTILRGITRNSLLTLGRDMGLNMREEPVDINELFEAAAAGDVVEAFACGTAAAVSPIGRLKRTPGEGDKAGRRTEAVFGDGATPGPVTMKLKKALLDVQRGRVEDKHGWRHSIMVQ